MKIFFSFLLFFRFLFSANIGKVYNTSVLVGFLNEANNLVVINEHASAHDAFSTLMRIPENYSNLSVIFNPYITHKLNGNFVIQNKNLSSIHLSYNNLLFAPPTNQPQEFEGGIFLNYDDDFSILFENVTVKFNYTKIEKTTIYDKNYVFKFVNCYVEFVLWTLISVNLEKTIFFKLVETVVKINTLKLFYSKIKNSVLLDIDKNNFGKADFLKDFFLGKLEFIGESYFIKLNYKNYDNRMIMQNFQLSNCKFNSSFLSFAGNKTGNLELSEISMILIESIDFGDPFIFDIEGLNSTVITQSSLNNSKFYGAFLLKNINYLQFYQFISSFNDFVIFLKIITTKTIIFSQIFHQNYHLFDFIGLASRDNYQKFSNFLNKFKGCFMQISEYKNFDISYATFETSDAINTPFIAIKECEFSNCENKNRTVSFSFVLFESVLLLNKLEVSNCVDIENYTPGHEIIFSNFSTVNLYLYSSGYNRIKELAPITIISYFATVTFFGCIFLQNASQDLSSAIYILSSQLKIEFCLFRENNIMQDALGALGSSVLSIFSQINSISNSKFISNVAGKESLLLFSDIVEGEILLNGNIFQGNSAKLNGAVFKMIKSNLTLLYISDSLFYFNIADELGGCFFFNSDNILQNIYFERNFFYKNQAANGAVIYFKFQSNSQSIINVNTRVDFIFVSINNQFLNNLQKSNEDGDSGIIFIDGRQSSLHVNGEESDPFPFATRFTTFYFIKNDFTLDFSRDSNLNINSLQLINRNFYSKIDLALKNSNVYYKFEFNGNFFQQISNYTIWLSNSNKVSSLNLNLIKLSLCNFKFENNEFHNFQFLASLIFLELSSGSFSNVSFVNCKSIVNDTIYSEKMINDILGGYSLLKINHGRYDPFKNKGQLCEEFIWNKAMYEYCKLSFDDMKFYSELLDILTWSHPYILIKNSLFKNNKGNYTGALHITFSQNVRIEDCIFESNTGDSEGGAIYINGKSNYDVSPNINNFVDSIQKHDFDEQVRFLILNSTFKYNIAQIGNAIAIKKIEKNKYKNFNNKNQFMVFIKDCQFTYSIKDLIYLDLAEYNLKLCKFSDHNLTDQLNVFCKNKLDVDLNHFAHALISVNLQENLSRNSENDYSKKILNIDISLENGERLSLIQNSFIFFNEFDTIENKTSTFSTYDPLNKIIFSEFKNNFPNYGFNRTIFNLKVEACLIGEIYDLKSATCKKCDPGLYSIIPNSESCSVCKIGMDCTAGGANLKILQGYWRPNFSSDTVLKCERHPNICRNDKCDDGYHGAKCLACQVNQVKKYIRDNNYECVTCGDANFVRIYSFLTIVGSLLFEAYYMYCTYSFNKILADQDKENYIVDTNRYVFMNVLTFYFQIISIAFTIDQTLPEWGQKIFEVIGNPSRVILFSQKCLFIEDYPNDYVYAEFIFIMSILFAKLILIFIVLGLLNLFKIIKINQNLVKICLFSFFFYEFTGILQIAFSFFPCDEILGEFYMVKDYNFLCYDERYNFYVGLFTSILIFIWAIVFPSGLFILLNKIKKKDLFETTEAKSSLGFLYYAYRRECYFWEIIQIFYKILLILASDLLIFDVKTKGLTLIIIILIFYLITAHIQPFTEDFKKMNLLLNCSNLFFISVILFALFARDNKFIYLMWAAEIFLIALNVIFVFVAILSGYFLFELKMKSIIRKIIDFFKSKKENENEDLMDDLHDLNNLAA